MKKQYSKVLFLAVAAIFTALFPLNLWLKHRSEEEISHALAISNLPCKVIMIDYSHDNFFEKTVAAEFELDNECVRKILRGREWVRVKDVNAIISMYGAVEGYTWTQGNKHSEISFFVAGKKMRCKLFYHVE